MPAVEEIDSCRHSATRVAVQGGDGEAGQTRFRFPFHASDDFLGCVPLQGLSLNTSSHLNDDRNVPSLHADEQEGRCVGCGTGIALRQAACLGLAHAVTVDALDFVGCCVRLIDRELESVCFSPPPSSSGVRAPVPAGGQGGLSREPQLVEGEPRNAMETNRSPTMVLMSVFIVDTNHYRPRGG
jgi:hypothetical protein